ncbi:MAG TPA: UDP-glucuronic acid dehydrogenase [Armatimonadetes bacterium]|nr:UDP-glucuronic acid dehydrogenase [Armatimonadota bacterium]
MSRYRIDILCTDRGHPVWPHLERWMQDHGRRHTVRLLSDPQDLRSGDILFLISCTRILPPSLLQNYRKALVCHASDLPKGRGWSPWVWDVLRGAPEICVTLLEAAEEVDSGPIWFKERFRLQGHELADEIQLRLFQTELRLMDRAVEEFETIQPQPQTSEGASFYPRRRPEDSRIDPHATLAQSFDAIRIADPLRYPAFFDYRGYRYRIRLEKVGPVQAAVEVDPPTSADREPHEAKAAP